MADVKVQIGLSAADIKDALRKRHPALPDPGFQGPGRWVTLEEWKNIDLLALDTWRSGEVIGYEVKTSRSDMRTELLNPEKRAEGVAISTRFYFAVPAGMLTPEEREFVEPDWEPSDYQRQRCTNPECSMRHDSRRRGFMRELPKPRGSRLRGRDGEGVSVHLGYYTDRGVDEHGATYSHSGAIKACCAICKGFGTVGKSKVELEAPMLWVPSDVGLVVVGPNGCSVLKESPVRKTTLSIINTGRRSPTDQGATRQDRQALARMIRWASFRPDPRHIR